MSGTNDRYNGDSTKLFSIPKSSQEPHPLLVHTDTVHCSSLNFLYKEINEESTLYNIKCELIARKG
jgi:hypothetical protein